MNTSQEMFLTTALLTALAQCGRSYELPEAALLTQLNLTLNFAVAPKSLAAVLATFLQHGWADYSVDEVTQQKRWKLTEDGFRKAGVSPALFLRDTGQRKK